MNLAEHISIIRTNEQKAHIAMYSDSALSSENNWIHKPVKTVMELLPYLEGLSDVSVLDLGCGIGRNAIPIAKHFSETSCHIDCVDILDIAIQKLNRIAEENSVSLQINGILCSIDEFTIARENYNLILAVSALEHVATKEIFIHKLQEIRDGILPDGIVCLIINSDVKESIKAIGQYVSPQFEVNFSADELQDLLFAAFRGWNILKSTQRQQFYDIPRNGITHTLCTNVITLAAQKP